MTMSQAMNNATLLDPGMELTLRPMRYPLFHELYKSAVRNTWTVEEIDFERDVTDLQGRVSEEEGFLIQRLVTFFATGDLLVANNVVLSLYRHINAPEARMYLSRQLFEESLHIQFYLTVLDVYLPDIDKRAAAFNAIHDVESIRRKGEFCLRWMDSMNSVHLLRTKGDRQSFLLNLICFAACIEGLFFFGAFAYVYFLRSRGLLPGLATGTNWVFRDETAHINFAFAVINTIREEEPELFDESLQGRVYEMMKEALTCEVAFAEDVLGKGIPGLVLSDMVQYLQCVVDDRLSRLKLPPLFKVSNPLSFMVLQDAQELTNFFERRVSSYQVGITGSVRFDYPF